MSSEIDGLLEQFAHASEADKRHWAAEELARGKHVNAVRHDSRFEEGLARCLAADQRPESLLTGISRAYRLGAASRPAMAVVKRLVDGRLKDALPPMSLLSNAKDRYYVALALADASGDWLDAYIAHSIAVDEAAETARAELAHQLLRRRALGDGLRLIAEALRGVQFETGKPAESAARRLRRVCEALRPSVIKDEVAPGDDVGGALKQLFEVPSQMGPFSAGERAWREAAEAACGLVRDILRTQLSLLADPEVYASLRSAAAWVDPRLWPRFVKKSTSAASVLAALLDAVALLAKQRVTDQRLITMLEFIAGGREAAAREAATLVNALPGVEPGVADWLRRLGRISTIETLDSLESAAQFDADAHIASLMTLTKGWSTDPLREATAQRVAREVERLARARRLSIRQAAGDVVEYSPATHELVGGHRLGVRRVRVVQPLVERSGSGLTAVIQKAIVESDEGG